MTQETCANCGHEKKIHQHTLEHSKYEYCQKTNIHGDSNCSCKKFKPKNHSPQEAQLQSDKSVSPNRTCEVVSNRHPEGDKTLSEKINSKWKGFEGLLYVKDVKNFIKDLKEVFDCNDLPEIIVRHDSDIINHEIDKLAGKNLI